MTIQRRNPVPPGVYWVDAPGPAKLPRTGPVTMLSERERFGGWLVANKDRVKLLKHKPEPDVAWYLFEVFEPVPWQGPGLPTFGDREMTQADTVQAPPPEKGGIDAITDAIEEAAQSAKDAAAAAAAAAREAGHDASAAAKKTARTIGIGALALGILWVMRDTRRTK